MAGDSWAFTSLSKCHLFREGLLDFRIYYSQPPSVTATSHLTSLKSPYYGMCSLLIGLLASVCVLLGLSLEPSDTLGLGWIKHVHEKVQTPLSALGKT